MIDSGYICRCKGCGERRALTLEPLKEEPAAWVVQLSPCACLQAPDLWLTTAPDPYATTYARFAGNWGRDGPRRRSHRG